MKPTGLENKVVIVTGGAAGIGRATALAFAAEHARVAIWDIHHPEGLAEAIAGAGGQPFVQTVDVTSRASVESAIADLLISKWDRVDVLVNNAGIVRDAQIVKWKDGALAASMSDNTFDAVLNVNLRGVFLCARAVIPHMITAGGGVILNASSVVGMYGNFGQTNYVASKAGVIGMTKTWARELGRYKIRVNAVAPGFVATEILRSMPDKIIQNMISHTPLGRLGAPEDVADAYVWLASDRAAFVTGAVLQVDGGIVVGT